MTEKYPERLTEIEDTRTHDDEAAQKGLKSVDTVHNDEALKVLANYHGEEGWTPQEEKKIRRKVDRRLMPILCISYGLQYYDKAMLGQAALFGLRSDLHLSTGNRYSMSSAIFYLGFFVGAYPAMYLVQRFPIERVASLIVVVWGICLMCTTACVNFQGLYAQRFFLGVLESGVSPMFMVIVGGWYKKTEQAFRLGIWFSLTGYVSIVSPLINYGWGHITSGPLAPWQYMYFFAGGITILWGAALWFILPPDPIRAKGFNERERYILVARLRTNNSGVRNTHFKANQVKELLLDLKFWLSFSMALLCMIANGPISTFIPIIINGFGFSTLNSLLLLMPVGFYSGTFQLITSYMAMKIPSIRTYIIMGAQLLTTLAAILLWTVPLRERGVLLFACIILPSLGAGYVVLMGLRALEIANFAGYTKRTLASSGLYMGFCLGNFVGPLIMKPKDAPRYKPGFAIVVITSIVAGVLALFYRFVCLWDNRQRNKNGEVEDFDHAYEDDLTDKKNPQFRYIY